MATLVEPLSLLSQLLSCALIQTAGYGVPCEFLQTLVLDAMAGLPITIGMGVRKWEEHSERQGFTRLSSLIPGRDQVTREQQPRRDQGRVQCIQEIRAREPYGLLVIGSRWIDTSVSLPPLGCASEPVNQLVSLAADMQ